MRYRFSTLLLLALLSFNLSAQDIKKALVFESQEADLGVMSIKDVKHTPFYYTNNSGKPVVIVGAKTSCGCTKATYSRRPVLVGARDSVMLRFEPNELGAFYKKVVLKDSSGETNILVVKGSVK